MANYSKIALGFLGGVAAGAIGAILLAPKSGRETISDINDSARRWTDQLTDQWRRMSGGRNMEDLQRRQDQYVEEARETLDDMPHRSRPVSLENDQAS